MKTCDVCSSKLGLQKFAYADGYICKNCYKIASRNYTETVCQKKLAEIKVLFENSMSDNEQGSFFEATRKIGNYLLVDDKNEKICIINNRLQNPNKKPEIYTIDSIKKIKLQCNPPYNISELQNAITQKEKFVILQLAINIYTGTNCREIIFLNSPVRTNSFAFKRIFLFANEAYNILTDKINSQKAGEKHEEVNCQNQ